MQQKELFEAGTVKFCVLDVTAYVQRQVDSQSAVPDSH